MNVPHISGTEEVERMSNSENFLKRDLETVIPQWEEKSDQELMETLLGLHSAIYNYDCSSSYDLLLYDFLRRELEERGYRIMETLLFEKEEEED